MKIKIFGAALPALALLLTPMVASSQSLERGVALMSEDVASQLEAYSYREGPESKLEFRGTAVALAADGDAEVEFQDGRARVDVKVSKLPDPWTLGPYTTFVLWAVTVDGRASNLGALDTRNGRGDLDTSTPLSQFALIVTAEPHFAVTVPSKTVVLRNLGIRVRGSKTMIAGLSERMDYSSAGLEPVVPDGRTPVDLYQARYAVAIARNADAGQYAADELTRSEARLAQAETQQASKRSRERKIAPRLAREAAQIAEDARSSAVRGAAEAERQRLADEEAKARQAVALEREESQRRERDAVQQADSEARKQARADLLGRLNRVLPTRETDRGLVAEIAGVQFGTGNAELATPARESLARFAGIVSIYPSMRFRVEGHTDSTGSYAVNRELSLQRAIGVRDYLIGQGVSASAIDAIGLGPDRPVASNDTADGRARNRRVEIVITGGPATMDAAS